MYEVQREVPLTCALVGYHSGKLSRSPHVQSAPACWSSTVACSLFSRPSLARLLHGCPVRSLFDRLTLDAAYLRGTPSHSRRSFQVERFETASAQVLLERRPWHMPEFCLSWNVRYDIPEYVNLFSSDNPTNVPQRHFASSTTSTTSCPRQLHVSPYPNISRTSWSPNSLSGLLAYCQDCRCLSRRRDAEVNLPCMSYRKASRVLGSWREARVLYSRRDSGARFS